MSKKKKSVIFKVLISVLFLILIIGSIAFYKFYLMLYQPNVNLGDKKTAYICIPTGSTYKDVLNILDKNNYLENKKSFEWTADFKNYTDKVKPGKYLIKNSMSNNELVGLLRSGKQEAVKLVINNIRTKEQLAGKISKQLEADSLSIINLLNNNLFVEKYGFSKENILVMFIPNTYEFYWNTSGEKFTEKMHKEYLRFWNEERVDKAANIGLTAIEVAVLASIVQSETTKKDEMSRIAGTYINRLNKNMLLQADPTVIFALQDFTIKRLFSKHLAVDSPYNTYKYTGLPPGPITLPEPTTIDKVLNYEKHDYLYFCAREDLSGYHAFAKSFNEHSVNARKFQKALNKLNIR